MTRSVQAAFGVQSHWLDENTLAIPGGQHYHPCDYTVEGDYSQAAFPAVLGAACGGVTITGLAPETLQGDAAILDILRRCGAVFTRTAEGISFEKAPLHGVDIDLADCPDLGPVLMVLGLLCEGTTVIRNAERLRLKESDRIAAMEAELRACGGVLDKSYYTQYSRTILALTACGENARDFAGYDLTAPLANYDQTVWQGVNGAAFALIAMDSVSYGFAASGSNSRARLVAYLLAQELPGGGWDYSGKAADPDQTAMVLQALAPYRTQANVSAAIDRALNVLSGMQKDDGSFDAWGASSSESISQVLVALCALGIDPAKDSRFVRANGAWLVSALMSFRVQTETGLAFGHTNRTANYMATEQAGYALAAYERFLAGQPALYTMTDTTYGTHTCVRYRDTARHWAQPYVCAVTEQGLMNGVGNDCFDPEGTLNRAMLATVLWRASGSPAADGGSFSDVPAGQWYSAAVSWAQQSGIVQGVGENRFAPMDSITREQLAVMLWRASGSPGSTQSLAAFPDAGTCSDWASTALAWAVERGILNGMDGRLAPGGTATRAQAAAMLTRYLQ
jgi:hypothetical protein